MGDESPVLLYNDDSQGVKFHSALVRAMETCDRFDFSVAFITMNGLATLYQSFRDLESRNIRGRILTTDYMGFNDPNALEWLINHTQHEIKVCEEAFHTKGYVFYYGNDLTSFVGSSNLTDTALCTNLEWNLKVISSKTDPIACSLVSEFNRMWSRAKPLTKEWIESYRRRLPSIPKKAVIKADTEKYPSPNQMQVEALQSLSNLRENGKKRALLISATGTGKTYLSAFDIKAFNPRRTLFLVHNENILKDAIQSFSKVLGGNYTFGLYTGNEKKQDSSMLFSTIQTMVNHKERFARNHFDYIVCDEAHHSTARMYNSIIAYFTPKFMLGMTATPERMDGADVFRMFDFNVAYEIRLGKALEMGILCPFHYYGVSEITIDGKLIDDKSNFNALTCDERVKNIIEKAEYYHSCDEKVHGLIFCSNVEECKGISEKMNALGYRTIPLSAENSIEERNNAIRRLQSEDDDCLDYIITRDIFNEGVDIPKVNQILMLRPTQSATIFVQQLGRGLRKTSDPNKSLVVLDFIGNYKNNFMIPIALSSDKSHDKDNIRRFIMNKYLPGCSTIGFEKIVEDRILSNIDRTNLSKLAMLKSEYKLMKMRLNHPPSLCDLLHGESLDPTVLVRYTGNINDFRIKAKEPSLKLSKEQNDALTFISSFVEGKRPHELLILQQLIKKGEFDLEAQSESEKDSFVSAMDVMDGTYQMNKTLLNHPSWRIIKRNGLKATCTALLNNMLQNPELKLLIDDVIKCGLEINLKKYSEIDDLGFALYKKYTRTDVSRILNWDTDYTSTMYGYKIKNGLCPIFVTYRKSDNISATTMYKEGFKDKRVFNWMSRPRCEIDDDEIRQILSATTNGTKLLLFIKKSDKEGSDFYYMGQSLSIPEDSKQTMIGGFPAVSIPLRLRYAAPDELFDYLTADVSSPEIESDS